MRTTSLLILMFLPTLAYADPEAWFPAGSPPAKEIYAVDLSQASLDDKLALITLQGTVNRGPESLLFMHIDKNDGRWIAQLIESGYSSRSTPLPLEQAFTQYADRFEKVIVYDPALPASINLATMIASVENGIVASPERATALAALGKPLEDLRGRWKTNVEAYRWAWETLWPKMTHSVLACYHPTATAHHLRDYLVRNRIFHFWVTGEKQADGVVSNHAAEMAFLKEVLAATPANIPVIGFWYSGADPGVDEYTGVGLAGEYGKITVVCDWAANLSILSGARSKLDHAIDQYQMRIAQPAPSLDPNRVYIAYDIVESGDSPSYMETRQLEVWKDPKRGTIPINWSLGPALFELAPPVAEYFYNEATPNDYIYMAISGAGYCHPYRSLMKQTPQPDVAWTGYLERTAQYLKRMRCTEIGLYTDAWKPYARTAQDPVTIRFAQGVPQATMFVLGMGRDDGMNAKDGNYYLGDRPALVSHILTRWPTDYTKRTREENIQWMMDDIRAHTPAARPAFMQVMALSWAYGPSEIAEIHQQLGEGFTAVRLPEYAALYAEAQKNTGK